MTDEGAPSAAGTAKRKIALAAGLGLIGVGAFQLFKRPGNTTVIKTITTNCDPNRGGGCPPQTFQQWMAECRSDMVSAVVQAHYGDIFGQYLRERWQDFLSRPDIVGTTGPLFAGGIPWDVQGQWIREHAVGYFGRPDFTSLWFGYPPRQNDAIGIYVRENGGSRCAPGTVTTLPPTGGGAPQLPPISSTLLLAPGMVIATACNGVAGYVVDTTGFNLFGYRLVKRWIADQASWNALNVPKSCLRLVTPAVIQALPNGNQLQIGTDITRGLPGVRVWLYGNPPGGLYATNAGYCS